MRARKLSGGGTIAHVPNEGRYTGVSIQRVVPPCTTDDRETPVADTRAVRHRVALGLVVLVFVGCTGAPTAPVESPVAPAATPVGEVVPIIIDTDMAPDDWLAILLLLGRADAEVRAITVTGTGEAHCEPGVRHALALVKLAGASGIPVACGRETPLAGDHAFPDPWREGVDALLGIEIADGGAPASVDAVELLTATVLADPGAVTVLALGPLTNVAEAIAASPELVEAIPSVVVMGGAVETGGNVGVSGVGIDNDVAEWNIYVDPLAAKQVLESGVAVTLVPLDATNSVPVTEAFAERVAAEAASPELAFAAAVFAGRQESIASRSYFFWDPLAAAVALDESVVSLDARPLTVVAEEGPTSGGIVDGAADGPVVRFATSADGARFEAMFLEALGGG